MRKLIFIIWCITSAHYANAQVTFEKNYSFNGIFGFYGGSNTAPALLNTIDSGYFLFTWNGDSDKLNSFALSMTRMNKNGDVLWNKTSDKYTITQNSGYGSVILYPDSSVVIARNDQYTTYNPISLVHLDKYGNTIWTKKYSGIFDSTDLFINNISYTLDNGIIVWGYYTTASSFPLLMLKADSAGNLLWCKGYTPDSAYQGATSGNSLTLTSDSGFLVTYSSTDSVKFDGWSYLMKTDAKGNIQWMKKYNEWVPWWGKPQIVKNNIYMTGIGNTQNQFMVIKTDLQGIPVWLNSYSGIRQFNLYDNLADSEGNTFISVGNFDTTSDITKIDSAGNVVWANRYGNADSSIITNLYFTFDGGIIGIDWNLKRTLSYPISSWSLIKTDALGRNGCEQPDNYTKTPVPVQWANSFCYITNLGIAVKDTVLNFYTAPVDTTTFCAGKPLGVNNIVANYIKIKIYPNPANTLLNIEIIQGLNQPVDDYFYLYDGMGQLIETNLLTNNFTTLPLQNVAEGIYYYRIVDNEQNEIKTDKLLIIR